MLIGLIVALRAAIEHDGNALGRVHEVDYLTWSASSRFAFRCGNVFLRLYTTNPKIRQDRLGTWKS
jgi:hypothetical protein